MAAKLPIFISHHFGENLENLLTKEFFNELVWDYEYNYITEIKIGKFYSRHLNVNTEIEPICSWLCKCLTHLICVVVPTTELVNLKEFP